MRRADLVADCGSCAALCCVATSFEASDDFAFDKPAGVACGHLTSDCRCAIHEQLLERGFRGCAAYDCHGAGQRVTRMFAGANGAERARDEVFLTLRVVHELLWLLTEAAKLCPPARRELRARLEREIRALDTVACGPVSALLELDLTAREKSARALLRRVGDALRPQARPAVRWRA